jgi:hypothetical protein
LLINLWIVFPTVEIGFVSNNLRFLRQHQGGVTRDNKTSPESRKAWLDDCRTPSNFAAENEVASTDRFKDHRPIIGKSSSYNQGIINRLTL